MPKNRSTRGAFTAAKWDTFCHRFYSQGREDSMTINESHNLCSLKPKDSVICRSWQRVGLRSVIPNKAFAIHCEVETPASHVLRLHMTFCDQNKSQSWTEIARESAHTSWNCKYFHESLAVHLSKINSPLRLARRQCHSQANWAPTRLLSPDECTAFCILLDAFVASSIDLRAKINNSTTQIAP